MFYYAPPPLLAYLLDDIFDESYLFDYIVWPFSKSDSDAMEALPGKLPNVIAPSLLSFAKARLRKGVSSSYLI